jgi:hypothetical protein
VTATISITGLEDWIASVDARLATIEGRLDDLNGQGWFDTVRAARYLASTPAAIRKAEATGKLEGSRSKGGRLLFIRLAVEELAPEKRDHVWELLASAS